MSILEYCKSIFDRQTAKGKSKYGTTLDDANLSLEELINHAQEEQAYLMQYLEAIKRTIANVDNMLNEPDKPKFNFQAIKPEATEDEMTYKWAIKETSFPLTQEYAILKPFVDFLEDECNIKQADIFLDYYLGKITTES